jgi:hypothetical protein
MICVARTVVMERGVYAAISMVMDREVSVARIMVM